jgi:hypothetical protein
MRVNALYAVCFLLLIPLFAHAQYQFVGLPGVENTVSMLISPENPEPGDTITFTLRSPVLDLRKSSVVWYVQGKDAAAGEGLTELKVEAGKLGEVIEVDANVSTEGITSIVKARVIPTEVEIIYDSNAYVPPFFRGRSLPAMGTQMRMQAVARFVNTDDTQIPDSDITYTWTRNGRTIPNASGKGINSVRIGSPISHEATTISVHASAEGGFEGQASITINGPQPVLLLYEDHPLFGLMLHEALKPKNISTEREMTIAALPLYSRVRSPNDPALRYNWVVNGSPVVSTTTVSQLTLGGREGGEAQIELTLDDDRNVFYTTSAAWNILFSPRAVAQPEGNLLPTH